MSWNSTAWGQYAWGHGVWTTGIDYSVYYLYSVPTLFTDKVSKQAMTSDFDADRVDGEGGTYAENIPVVYDSWLFHYPTYENLIFYSEDISQSVWLTGLPPTITGTDGFTSTQQYCYLDQNITTVDSAVYTFSFVASVESGGHTTGYTIRHNGSETGSSTVLVLTEIPTEYCVTVLGKSGGGTIDFGIQDLNSSNWAKLTISNFQVTKSTYRLPYVKTEASTVTVPNNAGSADEGNFFPIGDGSTVGDNLLNAFDGVADRVEIVTDGDCESDVPIMNGVSFETYQITSALSSEQSSSGAKSLKCTTTGAGFSNVRFPDGSDCGLSSGSYYEHSVDIYIPSTSTGTKVFFGYRDNAGTTIWEYNDYAISQDQWVTLTQRFTDDDVQRLLYIGIGTDAITGDVFYLDNFSVKEVSDATAELELEWMPMYSAGDIGADVNIIDIDGTGNYLIHDDVNNLLEVTDGTNTATVACSPVAGTSYKINIPWGDNSGQKMQIFLDDVGGSAVTNAGTFSPGNYLKFAYDNGYFFKTRNLKIYKEPQSWEIGSELLALMDGEQVTMDGENVTMGA